MRRGTTPQQEFVLPISTDLVAVAEITYKQGDRVILRKHGDEVQRQDKKLVVRLTQKETFTFAAGIPAKIQVRPLLTDGSVPDTRILTIMVEDCLSEEVLTL